MDLKSKMVANYFISSDRFFDDYLSRSLDFSMPPSEKGNHYLELQINIWYMHLILTRMYHGQVMEDAHPRREAGRIPWTLLQNRWEISTVSVSKKICCDFASGVFVLFCFMRETAIGHVEVRNLDRPNCKSTSLTGPKSRAHLIISRWAHRYRCVFQAPIHSHMAF